ncbi:hypothetical protein ACOSQ4_022556 [Xanthoceras sorbifolium]
MDIEEIARLCESLSILEIDDPICRVDGKGASLVESSVALGSIIGAQNVDVNNGNKKDIGSGLINRVAMEGVKVDEGDVLACATSEVGQIDAQMVKLNDSKEKNVKKWKRAAWAWSKSQILGKASSPLQRMLLASQKINKSPRRKNGSLGKQLPVSKSRQRSSPKISAEEDIAEEISKYFSIIFKSSNPSSVDVENAGTKRCISSPSPSSLSGQSLAWCPPSIGCLKLNSDVAIRDCFGAVGVGVAIRDLVGDIVAAASKVLPGSFSAEVGEFLALREVMLVS